MPSKRNRNRKTPQKATGVVQSLKPEISVNSQPERSSSTSQSIPQETGSAFRAMLLQDSRIQAMLQDSTFRTIAEQFRSALLAPRPEYLPSGKVENPGPPTGYVVDQRSPPPLSCTSIPPKSGGANLADPDGWSECLVTDEIKEKILSTLGFPAPLVHPQIAHFISSAPGKGLGIFATRDLDMGDLIYVERPLLVLPTYVDHVKIGHPRDWTKEQAKQAVMFEWAKQCQQTFDRLGPHAQAAYLALADIHTENGSGVALGICLTNGFGIEGLADIVGLFEAPYTGVCKEFSRANHSCCPNATRYFDLKTFAFCFSATRPIKSGEEITVGYGLLEDIRSARQQDLLKYGFECDCPACDPDSEVSDQNRVGIVTSADDLHSNYVAWVNDKTLPEDELIRTSRWWIRVIESEGLESSRFYGQHLGAIHRAYVALGDGENAIKYGTLLGRWRRAFGELDPPIASFSDLCDLQSWPDWAVRKASGQRL